MPISNRSRQKYGPWALIAGGSEGIGGEANRARVEALRKGTTEQAVEMTSQGSMMLYDKPGPGPIPA